MTFQHDNVLNAQRQQRNAWWVQDLNVNNKSKNMLWHKLGKTFTAFEEANK